MDIIEAINTRISMRAFEPRAVEGDVLRALEENIDEINENEPEMNFQLYGPREDGTAITMARAMFATDAPLYAALIAPKGELPEEKLGFYGERLVLVATMCGLGTCWVASTYDKETCRAELREGDVVHDVVPMGYAPAKIPLRQRSVRTTIRARSKKLEAMYEGPVPLAQAPEWLRACMDAVGKAPSAINEQPVKFIWDGENRVTAKLIRVKTGLEYTDLGIAKFHFMAVAHHYGVEGSWEWGDGGTFTF